MALEGSRKVALTSCSRKKPPGLHPGTSHVSSCTPPPFPICQLRAPTLPQNKQGDESQGGDGRFLFPPKPEGSVLWAADWDLGEASGEAGERFRHRREVNWGEGPSLSFPGIL